MTDLQWAHDRAYYLGGEAAVARLELGGAEAERPSLFGERADDPTPRSLMAELSLDLDELAQADIDWLCEAWENGVAQHYEEMRA